MTDRTEPWVASLASAFAAETPEGKIAALEADNGRLRAALEEVRRRRLYQLQQTCPDCEEFYGKPCTHGAESCTLLAVVDAALR